MLLDSRTLKPQVEDLVARFPRTPVWAQRYQAALERGFFTEVDTRELCEFKSCLVGEAMGWRGMSFDAYQEAYERALSGPGFAPLRNASTLALSGLGHLPTFEEALATAQLL